MSWLDYQVIRQSIKDHNLVKFKIDIQHLLPNEQLGLMREYRAYWWLRNKYSNDKIAVSNMFEDKNGIDFVMERDYEILYFAVSGPADQEDHLNCHYKIIVTNNKIYQQKVDHAKIN